MTKQYSEQFIDDLMKERDFWREKFFSLIRDPAFKNQIRILKETDEELEKLFD
jgi:hypothetical protein